MWNFNGVCTNIDDVENFLHSRFGNWSLEFTPWKTVELPVIWDTVTFMWRHCDEMDMSLCHTDDLLSHIQMIYSVTGMRQPLYLHITYPYGLTRLYLFHSNDVIWAPSCLKSPATRLFVHVLLLLDNKQNSQISTCCPFLRGIHRCLVDSRHKGRVMRKVLPCHDVILWT